MQSKSIKTPLLSTGKNFICKATKVYHSVTFYNACHTNVVISTKLPYITANLKKFQREAKSVLNYITHFKDLLLNAVPHKFDIWMMNELQKYFWQSPHKTYLDHKIQFQGTFFEINCKEDLAQDLKSYKTGGCHSHETGNM